MKNTLLGLGLLFVLTSCTSMLDQNTQSGSGVTDESGNTTQIQSPLTGDWEIRGENSLLSLTLDDTKYSLNAGCNIINGEYSFSKDNNKIAFEQGAMTMMACPDNIAQLETQINEMFTKINAYEITADSLDFSGNDVNLTFKKSTVTALTDTEWKLSSILINNGLVNDILFESSTLTLSEDGTVSGTAICNNIVGGYEQVKQNISFDQLGLTKKLCESEQAGTYEQTITRDLSQVTQFSIDRDTLILQNDDASVKLIYIAR